MEIYDIWLKGCKGILIDLDNTLYSYPSAHAYALNAAHRDCPHTISFDVFSSAYRFARSEVTKRLYAQGSCRSRFFAFQELAETWGIDSPYSVALHLEQTYWNNFLKAMKIDKFALKLLYHCHAERLPVCIVSDMTAVIQVKKIKQLGIEDLIKHLVTSEEVGAEKPNPLIFNRALKKLGVTSTEAVMVGDNYEKDVQGAKALGIRAYQFVAQDVI